MSIEAILIVTLGLACAGLYARTYRQELEIRRLRLRLREIASAELDRALEKPNIDDLERTRWILRIESEQVGGGAEKGRGR